MLKEKLYSVFTFYDWIQNQVFFFFKCVPLRIGTPFFTKLSSKLTVKLVADISKSSVKTQNFMVIGAARSLVIFESKKKLVYAFLLARATNQ